MRFGIWKTPKAAALARRAGRFGRDENGSLIIFGLIMLLMMFMAAGIAIDVIRTETTRTQLQNTLDRAVLAATDISSTQDAKSVVQDYFEKAGLSQYLGDDIDVQQTTTNGNVTYRSVTATAVANVPTMFMKLSGIDSIAAGGISAAAEGITDLEISLVVDVSGSMSQTSSSGQSKLQDLEDAGKDFAYYMQCNPEAERSSGAACTVTGGKVSISLIPYSEQVVVGSTLLDLFKDPTLTDVEITDEGEGESCAPDCVAQCVTFADKDFETTDVVAFEPLEPHYQLQRSGIFDAWSNKKRYRTYYRTCRNDAWREVRAFIEDHNDVYTYLEDLKTGGNTSADIGMKWGTTLLNPDIRPLINELTKTSDGSGGTVVSKDFSDRPYDNNQENTMKVVVLMTDGINTTENWLRDGYRDGPSGVYRLKTSSNKSYFSVHNPNTGKYYWMVDGSWRNAPYGDAVQMTFPELWSKVSTAWYEQFSWTGDPDGAYGGSTKDSRLHDICTAAKNAGITVYTVGFEVTTASDLVLADCASTDAHYFQANGTNLSEVFGTIASSINQLRLTQ